jgi:hypothetical protein
MMMMMASIAANITLDYVPPPNIISKFDMPWVHIGVNFYFKIFAPTATRILVISNSVLMLCIAVVSQHLSIIFIFIDCRPAFDKTAFETAKNYLPRVSSAQY